MVFGHIRPYSGGQKTKRVMDRTITHHYFHVEIAAKAYRADTGKIVTSMSRTIDGRGFSASAAKEKALGEAAGKYGTEMMDKILKSWNDDMTNAGNVQLVVSGIKFPQVLKLKNALRKMRWVTQLSSRGFAAGVQTWDVQTRLSAEDLAGKISEAELPVAIEITDLQQNKVMAKVAE